MRRKAKFNAKVRTLLNYKNSGWNSDKLDMLTAWKSYNYLLGNPNDSLFEDAFELLD